MENIVYDKEIVKVTPWFSGVRPRRSGTYQTRLGENAISYEYSYWTGTYWGDSTVIPEKAEEFAWWPGNQEKSWRGILKGGSK